VDLILANDPDADRLAVASPMGPDRRWRPLTGDELGGLLADHLLRTRPHDADDVLATTVVSSRLLAALAREAGVAFAVVLTGFKWVVRAPAPGQRLLFGYEEALGYSVGGLVRDKDGITAALVVAELVASLTTEGGTLQDRLDDLHRRHGAHVTAARSRRVEGSDWLARVTAVMAQVRAQPPSELAGRPVQTTEDLLVGHRLPSSDVLIWTVPGGRAVLRPSGTEPKVKAYAEGVVPVGDDDDLAGARAQAADLATALLDSIGELLEAQGL
jgi:phosphomannomutase